MTTTLNALTMPAVVTAPGEGRAPLPIRLMGHDLLIKASVKDSMGNFSVLHMNLDPMGGPPLHIHTREDEWFYVLKGELVVQIGDDRITAGAGTSVLAPRNVPHAFQNFTDTNVEAIVLLTPGALEDFFLEAGTAPMDQLEGIATQYGVVLVGPPLAR